MHSRAIRGTFPQIVPTWLILHWRSWTLEGRACAGSGVLLRQYISTAVAEVVPHQPQQYDASGSSSSNCSLWSKRLWLPGSCNISGDMGSLLSSVIKSYLTVWPHGHYACQASVSFTQFSSVQSLSRVWFFATPWTAAFQDSLSITNSWSLLKLMSIESVMPSSHLILCHPLLLPPSIFPSITVFTSDG